MTDDVGGHEDCQRLARSVFYHVLAIVLLLAVVSYIAAVERGEARLAEARASNFQAFYQAKNLRDLDARLAYKTAPNAKAPSIRRKELDDQRDKLAMARERNDAQVMMGRYEADAEKEAGDGVRATFAQIILLIAVVLAALAGPTRKPAFCKASLLVAAISVGIISYTYLS